LEERKNGVRVH